MPEQLSHSIEQESRWHEPARQRSTADASLESHPLPLATIPLTLLVLPPTSASFALVRTALRGSAVDLSSPLCLDNVDDPRVIIDLAVLDCSALADRAYNVLNLIRLRWPAAVVIGLSARSEQQASALLRRGADYALCRGQSPGYLSDVISAAGRRIHQAHAQLRITYGDLVLDRESGRVWCAGVPVDLTPRELQLFQLLFLRAGCIVSRRALLSCAWHLDPSASSNGLAVYIGYLRRKLSTSRLTTLRTERSRGYSLSLRDRQTQG